MLLRQTLSKEQNNHWLGNKRYKSELAADIEQKISVRNELRVITTQPTRLRQTSSFGRQSTQPADKVTSIMDRHLETAC